MHFQIYRSSAGSGKTFTLVLEYLALILSNPIQFRSVLAVTFTNKAANEMKQRIVKALILLSDLSIANTGSKEMLMKHLTLKTGLQEKAIAEKSAQAFALILHNYSDFSISTIDSFVNRLVRTFTRDLGLPSQFEVSMNSKSVISQMIDRLLSRVGHDKTLTENILLYLISRIDDEKDWNIDRQLADFGKVLMTEEAFLSSNHIAALSDDDHRRIAAEVRKRINAFEYGVKNTAKEIVLIIHQAGLQPSDLIGGSKGIGAVLISLMEGEDIKDIFNKKTINKFLDDAPDYYAKGAPKAVKEGIDSISSELDEAFGKLKIIRDQQFSKYVLFQLVAQNLNALSLSSKMLIAINDIIDETQSVHISEFNKRISALISQAAVPYIYERLGERYKHYLLDEFQDTSVLQWHNFLPLIGNSLSEGKMSMLVGDAKQSIYRWRGGEVEQFLKLPEIFRKELSTTLVPIEGIIRSSFNENLLDKNYRSSQAIVQFNNDFFAFAKSQLSNDLVDKVFDKHEQMAAKSDQNGFVQFDFLQPSKSKNVLDEQYCQIILERVHQLYDRGFRYDEIVVLVRTNKDGALIAGYLSFHNIPVVSADSLLLKSSLKVRLLVHALHCLINPDDRLQHVELAVCLMQLSESYGGSIETIDKYKYLLLNDITELFGYEPISATSGISLYDQVEELVQKFRLDQPFDAYVQFFLDLVYKYQITERKGIVSFLNDWPEIAESSSVILPSSLNAVQVMTIHKAKGLEFPAVIFPYADLKVNKGRMGGRWVDVSVLKVEGLQTAYIGLKKELESTVLQKFYQQELDKEYLDLVNLLYVVFTRAEKELHVISVVPAKESDTASFLYKSYLEKLQLWQEDKLSYELGRPFCVENPSSSSEEFQLTEKMVSEQWLNRLTVAPARVNSTAFVDNDALLFGRIFHEIASLIIYRTDADHILKTLVYQGTLTSSMAEVIGGLFQQIFHHEALQSLYEPPAEVTNEASMCSEDGFIYRADRFVRLNNMRYVIEYKTGKFEDSHLQQINNYMELINRIDQMPVIGYLVYITPHLEVITSRVSRVE